MATVNMNNVPKDYNLPTGNYAVSVIDFEETVTKDAGKIMDVATFEVTAHPNHTEYANRQQRNYFVLGSEANPSRVDEKSMGCIDLGKFFRACNVATSGDTLEMGQKTIGQQVVIRIITSEKKGELQSNIRNYFAMSEGVSIGPDEGSVKASVTPAVMPPGMPQANTPNPIPNPNPVPPAPTSTPAPNPVAPPPVPPTPTPAPVTPPTPDPGPTPDPVLTAPDGKTFPVTEAAAYAAYMQQLANRVG